MPITRGFILQASYRITADDQGRRLPVVHLYGCLENGESFLVRDDRQRPHFYLRAVDAEKARRLRAETQSPTDRRTFGGEPVVRIDVDLPSDVPPLRDRLHGAGIETFEADVRFATRYLIERDIKGGCEIDGESFRPPPAQGGSGLAQVFHNPVLRPSEVTVEPRVMSFDIETDSKAERLLAISVFAPGIDEVLIIDPAGRPMPENAIRCQSELAALDLFSEHLRAFDPDVITGWNIIDFDLSVLERVAGAARVGSAPGTRGGPDAHPQGRGLFRQWTGEHHRTPGARRHRSAARRLRAHGRLLPRCGGPRGARRGQGVGGRCARSPRRDHPQLRA